MFFLGMCLDVCFTGEILHEIYLAVWHWGSVLLFEVVFLKWEWFLETLFTGKYFFVKPKRERLEHWIVYKGYQERK